MRSDVSLIWGRNRACSSPASVASGTRGLDVSQVDVLVAELGETCCEPRVADRRRTHVDATTAGAEVERRTDHRDFATWWLKRHRQQG